VNGDGLGRWIVAVDRELLPADGVFRGEIRFGSDANTSTVTVHVQRASVDLSADTGFVHVILTAVDDDEALYRTTATARAGRYDFEFGNVAPGRYWLIAGSDMDHDGVLCDAGEACGSWRTTDAPTILEVADRDLTGIEFVIGFRMAISPDDPVASRP
jgi:serine protease